MNRVSGSGWRTPGASAAHRIHWTGPSRGRKVVLMPASAEEPEVGASFAQIVLAGSRAQPGA